MGLHPELTNGEQPQNTFANGLQGRSSVVVTVAFQLAASNPLKH